MTVMKRNSFSFPFRSTYFVFLKFASLSVEDVMCLKILDPAPSKMVSSGSATCLKSPLPMRAEIDLGKLNNRMGLKKGLISPFLLVRA